jgi:hypothetical protein
MSVFPDYFIFIGLGTLIAIFASQLNYTRKGNAVAIAGVILSAALIVHGIYRFTQREEPCGGMEELTQENMTCVVNHLGTPVIPK